MGKKVYCFVIPNRVKAPIEWGEMSDLTGAMRDLAEGCIMCCA